MHLLLIWSVWKVKPYKVDMDPFVFSEWENVKNESQALSETLEKYRQRDVKKTETDIEKSNKDLNRLEPTAGWASGAVEMSQLFKNITNIVTF